MTTSGVSILPITRDEIIIKALKKCGQLAEGEVATEEMIVDGAADLNRMIKGFQADGVKLWAYQELVLFLDPASKSYALGPGGARCVDASLLIKTTSTADSIVTATTVTLDSVSGILFGMSLGILCDDQSMFWTTVSGVAGSVVSFPDALSAQASSGAQVYSYTTIAQRPLRIEDGRVQISPGNEMPLRKLSRSDYFSKPNKDTQGTPTEFYYNPSLGTGTFYVWPLPIDSHFYLNLTAYRQIQIFVNPTDTLDMPDEDQQGVIWNLAREIAPEYGVDQATMTLIMTMAQGWLDRVEKFDVEEASVIFMPDFG